MQLFSELLEEAEKQMSGTYAKLTLNDTSKDKLYTWSEKQEIDNLIRTDEYHVTVTFSRKAIPELAKLDPKLPIKVKPIGWEVFGKDNLLVLKLSDNKLAKIFQSAMDMGATYDFDEYIPHISIAKDYKKNVPENLPDFEILLDEFVVEELDLDYEYSEESE